MNKRINGKRYSTESAKELGSWSNGYGRSDFKYLYETLYRKSTGEFFLYGEGGPKSQYAERCGDRVYEGEEIRPLTYEEAEKWAEDHLDADTVDQIFGIPDEDQGTEPFTFWIRSADMAKLRKFSAVRQQSVADSINQAIRAMLERSAE